VAGEISNLSDLWIEFQQVAQPPAMGGQMASTSSGLSNHSPRVPGAT
jgi:hypothetical protein